MKFVSRSTWRLWLALAPSLALPVHAGVPTAEVDPDIEVQQVLVPVVVLDRDGRAATTLGRDSFELRVDGQAQAIESFERGDAPFVAAIVIDCSASMVGTRFAAARQAARTFIDRLAPGDQVGIFGFDHRVRQWSPIAGDRDVLHAALDAMHTGGGTALYDALLAAIQNIGSTPGRKAVLLLSDGEDVLSRTSAGTVEREARSSDVVLYSFRLAGDLGEKNRRDGATAARLASLADDLGGRVFHPATELELTAAYEAVFDEMRAQYTLSFDPGERRARRWHRIDVRLKQPGFRVRARRGWLSD